MNLWKALDSLGGLAARRELEELGVDPEWITLSAWYGRNLLRVRNGWFARPTENPMVLRAWRVGGRLTCISASALHAGRNPTAVLHVEVGASVARLHDPDNHRRSLGDDAAVVVHWTRHPGPGDRRAVSVEHAQEVAQRCGIHGAGVPSGVRARYAASSESASRMV